MRLKWVQRGPCRSTFQGLVRSCPPRRGWHNLYYQPPLEEESKRISPTEQHHDQYIEGSSLPLKGLDKILTDRRLVAKARLSGIESIQQLEYEADVGHPRDIGSRMTDTAEFRQDLDLWRVLLEFNQDRYGVKGTKKIWLAMMFRGTPVRLDSDNRNATDLVQSIIKTSSVEDMGFLKAFVKDCIRRGVLQEQLFACVVGTLLLIKPQAASAVATMLGHSSAPEKADLIESFHLACQSTHAVALKCFCQVHSLFPKFKLYHDLIPSLWDADRASDAFMLHEYLLGKGDLPQNFEVLKPFVQHISSTTQDFGPFLQTLHAAGISFDAQVQRLHSALLSRPLEKIHEPRKISEELMARLLASFPFELAVRNLRLFGIIEVGPLFVRQMVKFAADPQDLKGRFQLLEELGIDLGSSAFVRLVRKLISNGVFEAAKEIADSDMHHDEYEDHDFQKQLLREYHLQGDFQGMNHALTILSEGDIGSEYQSTSNGLLLRAAIEAGDQLKILQTVDRLCRQGCLVEEDSLKLLLKNTLHPRTQINSLFDSVGFLIGLLQRLLGAGNEIPPWMWTQALTALAMQGRLEESETLLMWLADCYTTSAKRRSSKAENLSGLLTPQLQNAMICWSFKKASWKKASGNIGKSNYAPLPWLRGARLLKTLRDEYGVAIELKSLHTTFGLCIKRLYYAQGMNRQTANCRVGIEQFGMSPRAYLRSWCKLWDIELTQDEEDRVLRKILRRSRLGKSRHNWKPPVHGRRRTDGMEVQVE